MALKGGSPTNLALRFIVVVVVSRPLRFIPDEDGFAVRWKGNFEPKLVRRLNHNPKIFADRRFPVIEIFPGDSTKAREIVSAISDWFLNKKYDALRIIVVLHSSWFISNSTIQFLVKHFIYIYEKSPDKFHVFKSYPRRKVTLLQRLYCSP